MSFAFISSFDTWQSAYAMVTQSVNEKKMFRKIGEFFNKPGMSKDNYICAGLLEFFRAYHQSSILVLYTGLTPLISLALLQILCLLIVPCSYPYAYVLFTLISLYTLRHLPFGSTLSHIELNKQSRCLLQTASNFVRLVLLNGAFMWIAPFTSLDVALMFVGFILLFSVWEACLDREFLLFQRHKMWQVEDIKQVVGTMRNHQISLYHLRSQVEMFYHAWVACACAWIAAFCGYKNIAMCILTVLFLWFWYYRHPWLFTFQCKASNIRMALIGAIEIAVCACFYTNRTYPLMVFSTIWSTLAFCRYDIHPLFEAIESLLHNDKSPASLDPTPGIHLSLFCTGMFPIYMDISTQILVHSWLRQTNEKTLRFDGLSIYDFSSEALSLGLVLYFHFSLFSLFLVPHLLEEIGRKISNVIRRSSKASDEAI